MGYGECRGFLEQIGAFGGIASLRTIGVVVSLISPADSMWRLAAPYLQPEILRGSGALALSGSVPRPLMVWWAAGFTVLTLLYAIRRVPPPGFVAAEVRSRNSRRRRA